MRIRVEMAFGLLSTKCQIFSSNLEVDLELIALIFKAAARLHNFFIDNNTIQFRYDAESTEDFGVETSGSPANNRGYLHILPTEGTRGIVEKDARRIEILNDIIITQLVYDLWII